MPPCWSSWTRCCCTPLMMSSSRSRTHNRYDGSIMQWTEPKTSWSHKKSCMTLMACIVSRAVVPRQCCHLRIWLSVPTGGCIPVASYKACLILLYLLVGALVLEHAVVLLQSFDNTLQVVFANVTAQSMDPPVAVSDQPATPAIQAACSCKAATTSNGSVTSAEAAADAPPHTNPNAQTHKQPLDTDSTSGLLPAHDTALPDQKTPAGATQLNCLEQRMHGSSGACLATANSQQLDNEDENLRGQIAGYSWQLPNGVRQEECVMVWVGPDTVPALLHLHLTFNRYWLSLLPYAHELNTFCRSWTAMTRTQTPGHGTNSHKFHHHAISHKLCSPS